MDTGLEITRYAKRKWPMQIIIYLALREGMRRIQVVEKEDHQVSRTRSVWSHTDPIPIFDVGAPRSNGGIENSLMLCDAMQTTLHIDESPESNMHGWVETCANGKMVISR